MMRSVAIAFLLLATPAFLFAQAPLAANAPLDVVLDALDQRGNSLRDFTAKVKLADIDPGLGTSSSRTGQIWFARKADGDARLRVMFDKRISNRLARNEKIEYLLEDGWLVDRNYKNSVQVRRQVLRPGEKINLLKLGEGPFPLPIGQKKEDVHRLFDVKEIAPAKDDPADTLHVQLVPKTDTKLARRFTSIDVWVDRKTDMPARIDTVGTDQQLHRTELTALKINTPGGLKDADFTLPKIDPTQWSLRTEAYEE